MSGLLGATPEPILAVLAALAWLFTEYKDGSQKPVPALHPHDVALGLRLKGLFNEPTKIFLREHSFGQAYPHSKLHAVRDVSYWEGSEYEFENSELDNISSEIVRLSDELYGKLAGYAGPIDRPEGYFAVPLDHERAQDRFEGEAKRVFLHVLVGDDLRLNRPTMRRQLLRALAHGSPVLAVSETNQAIPDQIDLTCDVRLTGGGIDAALISDLLEAVYGREAASAHAILVREIDAAALTLDDLAIAIRPGRPIHISIEALAGLAARNRNEAEGDGQGGGSSSTRRIIAQSSSERRNDDAKNSKSSASSSSGSGSGGKGKSKRKPTGAEVVLPQPPEDDRDGKPPLVVETLSGYGAAKDWALGLRADLANYRSGDLDWSEMSTKLLLSGPPGTGKTTFARALCNSLQIPLVVTSVSTWLQGEYLHDVLGRMADTFAEARAQAPCILFIDEIDGIGMRVSASKDYADYWNACVNKLLELLDGALKSEGVIVVGATNRPNEIDEAIRRSGRLETHIEIPRPDIPALSGILAHHLGPDLDVIAADAGREGASS